MKIDVESKDNRLDVNDIELGTTLKQKLNDLSVRPERKQQFKRECASTVVEIILKLKERSPLNSAIVRNASSLSPKEMAESKEAALLKFQKLSEKLSRLKWITGDESDAAKNQFEDFLAKECAQNREKFLKFDRSVHSLDTFLGEFLCEPSKYQALWKVCKVVLVLSHGQAATERGFSVNSEVLDVNLKELSLVSQRMVYDHVKSSNINLHEYKLPSELIKMCKYANQKYSDYLEQAKLDKSRNEEDDRKKSLHKQIIEVKRQRSDLVNCIEVLKNDAHTLALEAEEKRDFTILAKSNALMKSAQEKEKIVLELDTALANLEKSKQG